MYITTHVRNVIHDNSCSLLLPIYSISSNICSLVSRVITLDVLMYTYDHMVIYMPMLRILFLLKAMNNRLIF